MAHIVMANMGMAHIDMAHIVMADIVMAHTVMAYVVMAYIAMAHVVMAYIVMACISELWTSTNASVPAPILSAVQTLMRYLFLATFSAHAEVPPASAQT